MSTGLAIETEELGKTYYTRWGGREITALAGLSLQVQAGAKYGLLGANGAGKTTFVKMLLAAVRPTTGRALLFGQEANKTESRRHVGYLPENHRFPTYFTGAGMLDFYGALSGMNAADRARRITELLELMGLASWGDVRIKKYSKGMLQRLGLAQALMHRPQLLILDEPTDGVDPAGRRHIRDVLNGLTGTGVTVFLNSHLLSEVELFCDHVAILTQGRLALEGKMANLLAGRGFLVTARQVSDAVKKEVMVMASGVRPLEDGMEFQIGSPEEVNRAIDKLRAGGALIHSVIPTTSSLEDVFLATTGLARTGEAEVVT
jgi:ABC-2 type transport system ATP-binding protein